MSRSAAAVAYSVEAWDLYAPRSSFPYAPDGAPAGPNAGATDGGVCRVLGHSAQGASVERQPAHSRVPSPPAMWQSLAVEAAQPGDTWPHAEERRPRGGFRVLLAPAAIALAVFLIGLGLAIWPKMAEGRALKLSGYTDQALTTQPVHVELPPAEAPPPPDAPQSTVSDPQPQPEPPRPGSYEVTGSPSTSVAQIERVLAAYGSPAAGKGQALYDLGVKYGIDPAYALAFFVHESGCGTKGVARFTKSLGNIRWTQGFANYEGYRS